VDPTVSSDTRYAGAARANRGTEGSLASAEPTVEEAGDADVPPSRDDVFDVLANRRRRYALHYLRRQGEPVALSDLAEVIAAWETGKAAVDLSSKERKRIYTALQQFHLPKMDEKGLLVYDRHRGVVSLAETTTDLDVYLDVVPANEIPWSLYYLGLSVLNAALLAGLWLDALPLGVLPDLAWIACFAAVFVGSAVAHTCYNRRMRLGAGDVPPDLPPR
jgi:hypothetical protein